MYYPKQILYLLDKDFYEKVVKYCIKNLSKRLYVHNMRPYDRVCITCAVMIV